MFCHLLIFFKLTFSKKIRNTIKVPNSLDSDHARHFVGHDLGPICLQGVSADETSRQRVNNKYQISHSGCIIRQCGPKNLRTLLQQKRRKICKEKSTISFRMSIRKLPGCMKRHFNFSSFSVNAAIHVCFVICYCILKVSIANSYQP